MVQIARGGLATSGDANRFLIKDGVRYSHILNPKTGYPITAAPASVTVAGENCTQAGLLATLSLLQGNNAEAFLRAQGLQHWCIYHQ
jgi:thiamine biosynthesis lipoprotein